MGQTSENTTDAPPLLAEGAKANALVSHGDAKTAERRPTLWGLVGVSVRLHWLVHVLFFTEGMSTGKTYARASLGGSTGALMVLELYLINSIVY